MGKGCPCVSRKKGAFVFGIFYLVIGSINTVVITLLYTLYSPEVLWDSSEDPLKRRQSLGHALIFYIPPVIAMLLLGTLLTLGAHRNDSRLVEASFIVSSIYVCGTGVAVVGMKLHGMSWFQISPMLVLLVIQMYNFMITSDYRDYILNHGKIVKTSTERRRLHEDPDIEVETNGNELLPVITRRSSNYSVRFKLDTDPRDSCLLNL